MSISEAVGSAAAGGRVGSAGPPNDAILRARQAYGHGRLDEALELFRLAHDEGTLSVDDLTFRMRTEYRLRREDEALETIEAILRQQPTHAEALKTGGRIANSRKDTERAVRFWQFLADADPDDPEGALQMARIALRQDELDGALLWSRRILAADPVHPEGLSIAALSGLRRGAADIGPVLAQYFDIDFDRAYDLLEQAALTLDLRIFSDALAFVRERRGDDERFAIMIEDACDRLMAQGLQAEIQSRDLDAAAFYRGIRRLRPGNEAAERGLERLRRYALIRMREAFKQNQVEQVILHGRKIVEVDPEFFEGWMTLGRIHFGQADIEGARRCFGHCVRIRDRDVWSWLNYARTLDRTGDWGTALNAYRRVLALESNDDQRTECERAIAALYSKALYAGRDAAAAGDVEAAWKHCAVAVGIAPDNDNVRVLKNNLLNAMHDRVRELWNAGSPEVADQCREYLKHAPDNVYVLQVLGRTLMNNRRFAEALPVWQHLAELQPDDSHFWLQVARCCNWLKKRADGIVAAREALRIDGGLAEAEAILGQLEALPER
jgi:tetratricopeptide (TPR) repeat protein